MGVGGQRQSPNVLPPGKRPSTHYRRLGLTLVIKHGMCMLRMSSVYHHLWPVHHFSTLPNKRNDFRKDVIEHKMCVLIFPTTSV